MSYRGSWRKRARIKRQLAVTERVCWLGLEPLNFEQTDPNAPDYVVIDEEEPCRDGGDPLDIGNCHLVCRYHNGVKGAKRMHRGQLADGARGSRDTATSRRW